MSAGSTELTKERRRRLGRRRERGLSVRRHRRGTRLGVGESRAAVIGIGLAAWVIGMLWIFPVAWTVLTSFKSEQDASAQTLHQGLSLGRYGDVSHSTTGTLSLGTAFTNSLVIVLVSTAIVMLLALPAAYALAIWMTRSFFVEVPRELIEAAEIDGTSLINQLRSVILPIAAPGIAATALLCVIFAWNEYFYAIQLNFAGASTMPQWVIGNVSTRGNFLAKLSAASVIACLPVVLAGWAAQKRMIRGLSMGAIK